MIIFHDFSIIFHHFNLIIPFRTISINTNAYGRKKRIIMRGYKKKSYLSITWTFNVKAFFLEVPSKYHVRNLHHVFSYTLLRSVFRRNHIVTLIDISF